MDLVPEIAHLPPRRRRRVRVIALVAFPVTAVMTVLVVALSTASIYWSHSPTQVALSIGLALAALVLCGVAGVNARRTVRARRSAPPSPAPRRCPDPGSWTPWPPFSGQRAGPAWRRDPPRAQGQARCRSSALPSLAAPGSRRRAAPVPPVPRKGAAMNPTIARTAAALDDLAAELAHADALVADQQARFEALEAEVARLQAAVDAREVAA